jgi:cyclopropane-fatty-acyl-phospholipid synthase
LRHLVRPTLDTLGRAYVEGKLDVEGKLVDVLNVAMRLAHADSAPKRRACSGTLEPSTPR